MADWIGRRSLGPTSVSGVALILAVCAAVWLTAGTRPANLNGAAALGLGYLAALSARQIARQTGDELADLLEQLTRPIQQAAATGPARVRAAARRVNLAARREAIVRAGWLAVLAARLSDGAVLTGLAVGATAQGWPDTWPLAISVLALIAIRETMTACSRPPEPGPAAGAADQPSADRDHPDPDHPWSGRIALSLWSADAALTMPFGGRILLIMVVAPVWGDRASLLGLFVWGIIAVGYGIAAGSAARRPAQRSRRSRRSPGGLAVVLEPPRPPEWAELHAERADTRQLPILGIRLSPPPPGSAPPPEPDPTPFVESVGGLASIGLAGPEFAGPEFAGPEFADPGFRDPEPGDLKPDPHQQAPARPADPRLLVIARCRDDGAISRWFGRLVRGQLLPLPAALLAFAGVATLAHLGLGDLPGILDLAPAIVMLVAAPGSSHPHSGPLDWLIPAILQGAQYIYITALGMAAGVPVAVTFLLCTAIALRYADLGCAASPPLPARRSAGPAAAGPAAAGAPETAVPERGTWMGWEGRMLLVGLGAAMGIAVFAYVALAAYVTWLVCSRILTSCLVVGNQASAAGETVLADENVLADQTVLPDETVLADDTTA